MRFKTIEVIFKLAFDILRQLKRLLLYNNCLSMRLPFTAGYDTIGRQQRSAQGAAGFNQMRSFSVPSGTQGGPSTPPPPKHVGKDT